MNKLLQRFWSPKPPSQAHVIMRATAVINHVIFDVGIDTLVGGTFVLDKRLRLRFVSMAPARPRGVVALLKVSQLEEAVLFRGLGIDEVLDMRIVRQHSACLARAVVRDLGVQSAALRALPAAPAR
ncbi:hypothetical protein [Massilia eurypsychrophila]|uniref:hypothetical protein n=1 Tax=Massilia eurypsychrophila TaxID=1485217 RepID=UPI001034DC0C|nr:hypothetical protein [Massilia eurypsychrophila]